jgi:excisionase family DNA binding protein
MSHTRKHSLPGGDDPAQLTPQPRYLDKRQVGIVLGISPRTVEEWMQRGLIPYFKIGRTVRFSVEEISNHLATHCRAGRIA